MEATILKSLQKMTSFIATCNNICFFNPELMSATTTQTFRDLHDFTVDCSKPMASIFCLERDSCRKCGWSLSIEKEGHPVVAYHSERGTYLGSCLTKLCRVCKIYEHYGYYTIEGKKHYDLSCLQLAFLLSTVLSTWLSLNNAKVCCCFCHIFRLLQSSVWLQVGRKEAHEEELQGMQTKGWLQ